MEDLSGSFLGDLLSYMLGESNDLLTNNTNTAASP